MLEQAMAEGNNDDGSGEENKKKESIHQIDRLVVQLDKSEKLTNSAEIISRLLARRHYSVTDFEITVPELLLKQQQRQE